MARPPLPALIGDLVADRRAANALLASTLALLAAGLDPKILAPLATTTQALVRARPEVEGLLLLLSVVTALSLLVGGAIGDTARARRIIVTGLTVALVAAVAAMFLQGAGTLFHVVRFAGIVASAIVMPTALAVAATSYRGIPRATAIGIAYAGYGIGQGISPFLVSVIPGNPTPAFLAAIAGLALALAVVRGRLPDLERATTAERRYVLGTPLWAGGVVLVATSLLWFGAEWDDPLRLTLLGAGIVVIVTWLAWSRWRRRAPDEGARIDRRPVTVALFVGLVIAFAQIVPMTQLPSSFGIALAYGPILGVAAIAPIVVGLVLAGPLAGWLIARAQPRSIVLGGMVALGIGDLAIALVLGASTPYLVFLVPMVLVGAGYAVAATVRTAIIFAAVPRGLPATAAALNEASIEVGSRAGLVIVTVLLAQVAVTAYANGLMGTEAEIDAAVGQFQSVLTVLGLPGFTQALATVPPSDLAAYRDAYLVGVRVAMAGAGIVVLGGAGVAWLVLGRRDPLRTVYELRDERAAASP